MAVATVQLGKIRIVNNRCSGNIGNGINIYNLASGSVSIADLIRDCLISGNTCVDNTQNGIRITGEIVAMVGETGTNGSSYHIISNNHLITNGEYGIKNFGTNVLIATNVFSGNTSGNISDQGSSTSTQIHPIGFIYQSVVSTSPATLFGYGTWSAFATGRVLVGLDSGQTEFDTVEETGGAKTHTLVTSEMPAHIHTSQRTTAAGTNTTGTGVPPHNGVATGGDIVGSTGGGGAHNNLQPYIVVYMWKRTA